MEPEKKLHPGQFWLQAAQEAGVKRVEKINDKVVIDRKGHRRITQEVHLEGGIIVEDNRLIKSLFYWNPNHTEGR